MFLIVLCTTLASSLPQVQGGWFHGLPTKPDDLSKGVSKIDDLGGKKSYFPAEDVNGGSKNYYIPGQTGQYLDHSGQNGQYFGHGESKPYYPTGHTNGIGDTPYYPTYPTKSHEPTSLTEAVYQPLNKQNGGYPYTTNPKDSQYRVYPGLYYPVSPKGGYFPDSHTGGTGSEGHPAGTPGVKSLELSIDQAGGSQDQGNKLNTYPVYPASYSSGSGDHGNSGQSVYTPSTSTYQTYPGDSSGIYSHNKNSGGDQPITYPVYPTNGFDKDHGGNGGDHYQPPTNLYQIYKSSHNQGSVPNDNGKTDGLVYPPQTNTYPIYGKSYNLGSAHGDLGNNGESVVKPSPDVYPVSRKPYNVASQYQIYGKGLSGESGDLGNKGGHINQAAGSGFKPQFYGVVHGAEPTQQHGGNGGNTLSKGSGGVLSSYFKGISGGCSSHGILPDHGTAHSSGTASYYPNYPKTGSIGLPTVGELEKTAGELGNFPSSHTSGLYPSLHGIDYKQYYPVSQASSNGHESSPTEDGGLQLIDDFKKYLSGASSKTDDAFGHGVVAYPKESGKTEFEKFGSTSKYPEEVK
ncbi:uncharacterized protein LOC134246930, partial [Saccostrea cucullata]|uniref:uncharacterized protein LOC134246930 n=1 Tax=Saccostrea cuccullata TaxID=36930 RepID=UPI002ED262BC